MGERDVREQEIVGGENHVAELCEGGALRGVDVEAPPEEIIRLVREAEADT